MIFLTLFHFKTFISCCKKTLKSLEKQVRGPSFYLKGGELGITSEKSELRREVRQATKERSQVTKI